MTDNTNHYGNDDNSNMPEIASIISNALTLALEDKDNKGLFHPQHLLISLIDRSENVQSIFKDMKIDPEAVMDSLEGSLDALAVLYESDQKAFIPAVHPDVKEIFSHLRRRSDEYAGAQDRQLSELDMLHAIFLHPSNSQPPTGDCARVLEESGLTREDVEFYLNWKPGDMPLTTHELDNGPDFGGGTFDGMSIIDHSDWSHGLFGPDDSFFMYGNNLDEMEFLHGDPRLSQLIDISPDDDDLDEDVSDEVKGKDHGSTALVLPANAAKPQGHKADNLNRAPKGGSEDKKNAKNKMDAKKDKKDDEERGEALAAFTTDLTELAMDGKLDPIIGADEQVDRAIQVLSRKTKNNPVFKGKAGVGKTARIEHLAQRIVNEDVPESLKGAQIVMLDLNAMVAGTRYRGDFEKRLKDLIDDVIWYQDKVGPIILGIDEIHMLVGAGQGSGFDASNILKPALARGQLRVIGGTTTDEYKKYIAGDKALDRRFQGVDVGESSPEEALKILKGRQADFEEYHGVKYSPSALKEMVRIATRFMRYRALPDSAIDLMDEAGALLAMNKDPDTVPKVNVKAVRHAGAKATKIPFDHLSQDDGETLKNLGPELKKVIYDQDDAIDSLVRAYKRSRAGIRPPNKTIGSFFFPGPSGSGKTETAKQLANKLNIPLVRIDMSEYMERHSVGRLIGSPKGYQGAMDGGQLTNAVRENPYSVLLIDEIEKAHPDVLNILLQLMDNGKVTDGWGNEVDFSNVILIMTSNVGAGKKKNKMGFTHDLETSKSGKWDGEDELRSMFLGEFLNRVDEVIGFNALKKETMPKIVMREILDLEQRLEDLHDRGFSINIDQESIDYLSQKGYDPANGARPLQRLMEREIGDPLSDEILGGKLKRGGKTTISFNGEATGEGQKKSAEVLKFEAPALDFEFGKVTKPEARRIRAERRLLAA